MKKERLNCEKARNISIVKTLENLGYFPKRKTEKEAWFLSPFRSETQASFKVDLSINRWYDHGEGLGGNILDLIMLLKGYSISEVLSFLSNDINLFFFHQQENLVSKTVTNENVLDYSEQMQNKCLEHKALIEYLKSRSIPKEIARIYCTEIHYERKEKKYFAIGFKNNKGGYELRNKYFKGCIHRKDITTIKNGSNQIVVFEGFLDFLSYKTLYKTEHLNEDYIILNSTALVKKIIPNLKIYTTIYLCLDNDEAGDKSTTLIKKNLNGVIDCRITYSSYKDLNEYLGCKNEIEDGQLFK